MPMCVCAGALLTCSFGLAPSTLMVTPEKMVTIGLPAGTVMDYVPMKNIMPFGLCRSPANPAVAAATAAALGVLTPAPCIPATAAPWAPGSPAVRIKNFPALHSGCKLICSFGGQIQIANPGTTKVQVK